jgi:hypothetical protein
MCCLYKTVEILYVYLNKLSGTGAVLGATFVCGSIIPFT